MKNLKFYELPGFKACYLNKKHVLTFESEKHSVIPMN